VKVRFQADNDLKRAILQGVVRREPAIDFQSARVARLDGLSDSQVLRHAAADGRIVVSHDVTTMPDSFAEFLANGNHSPGLFLIPQAVAVGAAIESLVMVWIGSDAAEWENRLVWLPL
jgi:hypothetical protein